jgi:hypothetical protein
MTASFIHSLERYVELEWDMGWSDDVNWKIKGKLHFTSLHVDSAMFMGMEHCEGCDVNCKLNENFNSLYRAPEHTSFNNVVNNLMQDLPPNLGTVT